MKIEESLNVTFDETPPPSKISPLVDDDLDEEEAIRVTKKKNLENDIEDETLEVDEIVNIKESKNHPLENVIGNLKQRTLSVPTSGPYQTNPHSPDEMKLYVQVEREDVVIRIRHDQAIDVEENQIFTREITPIMNTWVDIIRKNVFCLGGNRDHVPACLCHMLILSNDHYVLYDHVMYPLTAQQERKTRKDYGTKRGRPSTSTSSSSAFGQPSSSHHIDDDNDGNNEGTSRASTPSLTRFVNSLSNDIPQVFSNPPNVDPNMEAFYTRQTETLNRQVQFHDEHQSGLRSIGKGIKNLLRGKKK
ncbi:hypothetical protein Tco_0908281 [Tanacetum coccineum]|uniref:Uncharacterized protein n=1 Tax=Tanacetum coccineum TaxID=301880 RepID=A0ABQ5CQ60_9ASTR